VVSSDARPRAGSARDAPIEEGAPGWVNPVAVLWADFPERYAEHDGVTYVHGDELIGSLRSLPSANGARPVRVDSQTELAIAVDIAKRLGISP
jgi:hypothetical protein